MNSPSGVRMNLIMLLTIILVFVALPVCLFAQSKAILLPDDPLQGRVVFEKKGCIQCHAIFGYGGTEAPDLGETKFYGSLLDLGSILWNHSPQMSKEMRQRRVARPDFSEQEMYSLLAYLYFLPYLGDVGDAANGKKLLQEKGCLSCHSAQSKNGASDLSALSRYASPLYMAQSMWNHLPTMGEEMNQATIIRPTLTGKDMIDISTYIRKANPRAVREKIYMSPGNPNRGKKVFDEKKCSRCHSTIRGQESIAKNLAESNLQKSVLEISASLWNHGLQMNELMRREKIDYPIFDGQEMADVFAFLYFLSFAERPGSPAEGQKLFRDKGCASCHGTDGNQLIGPDVQNFGADISSVAIVQAMWNHAGIMQQRMLEEDLPWPELENGELAHLVAYIKSAAAKGKK